MIIDKNELVAFLKPYKASTASTSLVITLPKCFNDVLKIDSKTDLMLRVDKKTKELIITKVDNMNILEMIHNTE